MEKLGCYQALVKVGQVDLINASTSKPRLNMENKPHIVDLGAGLFELEMPHIESNGTEPSEEDDFHYEPRRFVTIDFRPVVIAMPAHMKDGVVSQVLTSIYHQGSDEAIFVIAPYVKIMECLVLSRM
jgi:hypothetical protein